MASPGRPKPTGTLSGAGPGPGLSPASPPAGPGPCTLSRLKDQLPRLQLRVTAQLESICHLFTRVRQDLQEHHKQVDAFLQAAEACSPALHSHPAETNQGQQEDLSPEVRTPQAPDFEDVVTARSSDWRRRPRACWDEEALWPGADPEPWFWQDLLTWQLWQIFADVHDKGARPRPAVTERALGLPCASRMGPRAVDGPLGVAWASLKLSGSEARGRLAALLRSPSSPGQDSEGPESLDMETGAGDPSAPILAESPPSSPGEPQEEETAPATPATPAQGPAGGARPLLKLMLQQMRLLRHGEPVLAAAVSSFTRHAFTCSRGGVKVWSLVGQVAEDRFPDSHLPVHTQAPGAYLRTCLLSTNSRALLTGGHNLGSVSVWDLAAPSLCVQAELPCPGLSCQALAADLEENLAFAGFTDGAIRIWDLRDQRVVRDLSGQPNGAKSLVVKAHTIWTGGLDARLRRWDLRMVREPLVYLFESQIMSLSHSPQEDWLLLGMANGQHWLQHSAGSQARMVGGKEGAVLGLKFSPYGQWWVSVGMDELVSLHSMPTGAPVVQVPEPSCLLCCDVSSDNRLVVAGAGDQASVYLVNY